MGGQYQPDAEPKPDAAVLRMRSKAPYRPGQQDAEHAQHQQGVTEASVIGHVGDRIAIVQHHIHIRQRAQQRAIQQRLAALPATEQGTLYRRAQYCLGDGIHQRLCSLSSAID